MTIYTAGFAQKSAFDFFEMIKRAKIRRLIDVRLNNTSQLAGFTKKDDLKYFLKQICDCDYQHIPELSPTKEILDQYKSKKISWDEYEVLFNELLVKRGVPQCLDIRDLDHSLFLCSEPKAEKCHRRLVVDFLKTKFEEISVIHL